MKISPRSLVLMLAVTALCWLTGMLLQSPWRDARLQKWQSHLLQHANTDLEVIEQLRRNGSLAEVDAMAKSLAKGLLVWHDSDDAAMSPQNVSWSWSLEPGGSYRLKLARAWLSEEGQRMSATLFRRYSEQDVSGTIGHSYGIANLLAVFGGLLSFLILWQREKTIQESEWIQRLSTNIGVLPDAIRASEWSGIRETFAQSVYAMADSMKRQISIVQETHERSSQAMTSMPIGILTFNEKLKLDFANPAGKALLGIEFAEIGQRLLEVIRIPAVVDCILETHTSGVISEIEIAMNQGRNSLRLKAIPIGRDRSILETAIDPRTTSTAVSTELANTEKSCRVLVSIADETRLKQLENLRRDFTANVSHELKTPLSSIKAYAETLLMGAMDDPDARQHFIERIEEQATRLEALIADLLQLSRLQSQPDKPNLYPISIYDVIKACVDDHQAIAERRRVNVELGAIDSVHVNSDLQSIQAILANILSNAIRYNKQDGFVQVSTSIVDKSCVVCVRDTGIGIPPEDLDRIFERFYRVEKARSQESGGTGLGLSIVKHLCQLVSAEIQVTSQLNVGSQFAITFPLADSSKVGSTVSA